MRNLDSQQMPLEDVFPMGARVEVTDIGWDKPELIGRDAVVVGYENSTDDGRVLVVEIEGEKTRFCMDSDGMILYWRA